MKKSYKTSIKKDLKKSKKVRGDSTMIEQACRGERHTIGVYEPKKGKIISVKKSYQTSIKKILKKTKKVRGDSTMIEQACNGEGHTIGVHAERLTNADNLEDSIQCQKLNEIDCFMESKAGAIDSGIKTKKLKKIKPKINSQGVNAKENNTNETPRAIDEEKVDEISQVDGDCTRGMNKWLKQYKESRPGFKVLQARIDEFITAHEERQVQEKREREALAAEGGWTVVVHQKGRKKTTEAETGTTVGSAAPVSITDVISKKKNKEITLDFYRFQRREAKMNEILMLQSKFEQDKKRIQQLRAARKFKPY